MPAVSARVYNDVISGWIDDNNPNNNNTNNNAQQNADGKYSEFL